MENDTIKVYGTILSEPSNAELLNKLGIVNEE